MGHQQGEVRPPLFAVGDVVPDVLVCSFNLGETIKGSGQCVGALAGLDIVGGGDKFWLLGDRYAFQRYLCADMFPHVLIQNGLAS